MSFLSHRKPREWIRATKASLDKTTTAWDVVDLSAALTLVLLILLHTEDEWYFRTPIIVLCIAAIVHRPLYRTAAFWLVIAGILAVRNYGMWYAMANHEYLINYWCLALGLSFLTSNPQRVIAVNARILIGLAFSFAVLWKGISRDYLDGTFFHYLLLSDTHFKYIAHSIGGLAGETISQNTRAIATLNENSNTVVQLQSTPYISWIAQFLTWWSILLEGFIAIAFLCPVRHFISRWRDLLLLVFLVTTYTITPVVGFGWILAAIGTAQCSSTFRHGPLLYIVAFLFIELCSTPWMDVLARLL